VNEKETRAEKWERDGKVLKTYSQTEEKKTEERVDYDEYKGFNSKRKQKSKWTMMNIRGSTEEY
jgi:hypothetical protein